MTIHTVLHSATAPRGRSWCAGESAPDPRPQYGTRAKSFASKDGGSPKECLPDGVPGGLRHNRNRWQSGAASSDLTVPDPFLTAKIQRVPYQDPPESARLFY